MNGNKRRGEPVYKYCVDYNESGGCAEGDTRRERLELLGWQRTSKRRKVKKKIVLENTTDWFVGFRDRCHWFNNFQADRHVIRLNFLTFR